MQSFLGVKGLTYRRVKLLFQALYQDYLYQPVRSLDLFPNWSSNKVSASQVFLQLITVLI